MSDTLDTNGIRIKAAHNGHIGPAIGRDVYILRREDDTVWGPFDSRHEAIGYYATDLRLQNQRHWLDIETVPIGAFRIDDWRTV